jgi:prolycopene isomerase
MSFDFFQIYLQRKQKTLKDLLDEYFKDKNLKAIFSTLAVKIGLPPSEISILTALTHYRELVLDAGYYIPGGLQRFAEAFAKVFVKMGGEIVLSQHVKKIKVISKKARGIILDNDIFIPCRKVVSNIDPTQTFLKLIDEGVIENSFKNRLLKMKPSISVFSIYLGLKRSLEDKIDSCYELLYSSQITLEDPWRIGRLTQDIFHGTIIIYLHSLIDRTLAPSNKESISLNIFAPYLNEEFWEKNKDVIAKRIIRRIEEIIPNLSNYIYYQGIAPPVTFYRYTLNRDGAKSGWASIISQIDRTIMPSSSPVESLYLVGHWVTLGSGESGLPTAALTGRNVAKMILYEEKVKQK